MIKPVRADTIQKRRVQWLWKPFIQRCAINLLTGGPGTGKSTIACDIAAALSKARPLPGETEEIAKERGIVKTLLLNAEDDPEDTIAWRLDNQDADRSKIFIVSVGQAIGRDEIGQLHDFIKANGIGLGVVDPVQAWIGTDTDMYRPNHMRAWGNLFKGLCQDTGVTWIWVRHRRKGDADDHASINSGLGSIDLSGIVRSEIGAIATRKGSSITRIKGSVGETNLQLSYAIGDTGDPENDHGRLQWQGDIRKVKSTQERKQGGKSSAVSSWIIGHLTAKSQDRKTLLDAGERLGYSKYLINKAIDEVSTEENGLLRLKKPGDDAYDPTD